MLPAALLVAVATLQIALAFGWHLNPWLGGGFGMFASADSHAFRHLHAFARGAGIRRELRLRPELAPLLRSARILPTESALRALARALGPEGESLGPLPESIEIQVWGTDYDPESLAPRGRLIRSAVIDVR